MNVSYVIFRSIEECEAERNLRLPVCFKYNWRNIHN